MSFALGLALALASTTGTAKPAAAKTPAPTAGKPAPTSEAAPVHITCDDMVVQNRSQTARCLGHVKATRLLMILTCDESLAHYDQDGHIVDMICFRHVKVVENDRVATGDKGVYVEALRTVELTGNAVLKQKGDVLQGEPIVFYVDEDRVVAKGARLLGTTTDLPGAKIDGGVKPPGSSAPDAGSAKLP